MKKAIVSLLLLAIGGGGAAYYWRSAAETGPRLRTAPVERGDLVVTITATGTVEPVEVVDVGAQIAGRIVTFGSDAKTGKPIDFRSQVEQGTVLARIDETLYAADVQAQQAQVDQAIANRDRAKAELTQDQAQFRQAERDWKRAQQIMSTNPSASAATDYDGYQAKYELAQATLSVGQASIEQTEKAIALARANLIRAKTNLGYCTIASPVNGVIIDRRVNIGQTVVASLNAPSLFLIAKDLRNMQVWVAVNEMDIGRIHPGQPVTFTVDTFPGMTFLGTVNKIRLNASMTQNVVTYTVEVDTGNADLKLFPYMSATVKFEVSRETDVLTVPNNALNWTPQTDLIAPNARQVADNTTSRPEKQSRRERQGQEGRRRDRTRARADTQPEQAIAGSQPAGEAVAASDVTPHSGASPQNMSSDVNRAPVRQRPAEPQTGTVWVPDGDYVRPIRVTIGGTDGVSTEVSSPDLREDMEVVIGQQVQSAGGDGTVNPFAPKFPTGRGTVPGGGRRGM